jgi:hypothetical protein
MEHRAKSKSYEQRAKRQGGVGCTKRYWILDAGYKMHDTGCKIIDH